LVNTAVARKKRPRGDSQAAVFRAAAQEFAERGYEAARVDRIAERARVNKAMLYYHYRSKQGLYTEVLRDMLRAVGVRARAIADAPEASSRSMIGGNQGRARRTSMTRRSA